VILSEKGMGGFVGWLPTPLSLLRLPVYRETDDPFSTIQQ